MPARPSVVLAAVLVTACLKTSAIEITTLDAAYTQNFDALASSGTSSTLPLGWSIAESGTNANGAYTAGTGSSNTGDTYSFGAAASTERALGGVQSGTLVPMFGVVFENLTGGLIDALDIAYVGEQWRIGTLGRSDRLDFQYSTDASALTTGTWTDVDGLDFVSPTTTGSVGALNGNDVANRTSLVLSIVGLTIFDGASVWLRWTDVNASGSDDGLAIDEFSLVARGPVAAPGTGQAVPDGLPMASALGAAVLGLAALRRRMPAVA